jgi:predicted RNA-binding Zn-ribbon protein involved in translation (DUF1610 family)
MKEVRIFCPGCGSVIKFKNWFHWIWQTPIHWFSKRRVECPFCGEVNWLKREKK